MKVVAYLLTLTTALAITSDGVANVKPGFLQIGVRQADARKKASNETLIREMDGPVANAGANIEWSETSKFAPSVQYLFVGIWIFMIAGLPTVVPIVNRKTPTKSQLIVGALMMVVFFGGLLLFTNIILFQSVHFKRIRPLTMIECMYFMSQVITTVGYGDITPAKVRGQVFVGLYVLGAMFIISMVVSDVVNQLIESVVAYKKKPQIHEDGDAAQANDDADKNKDVEKKKMNIRKGQRAKASHEVGAASIEQMLSLAPPEKPKIQGLLVSLAVFAVIDAMWVLFFSLNPDEGKNVFQAIYMSVITLSSVGFGWFTPVTEEGMIFAAYFMIFGCAALVNVITQFTELMMKLNEYEKAQELCDHAAKDCETLLDHFDTDGKISEMQFTQFCLLQMKIVQPEHFDRIQETFNMMKQGGGQVPLDKIKKDLLKLEDCGATSSA
jgi:uncharacterized protein YxeA